MVNIGDAVTVKKRATGETRTGKVSGFEIKVKLDDPIVIQTPWYNDMISEVIVPKDYEIVPSGGRRKTKTRRQKRKGTRRV
jgi:hypothetical protein